MARRVGFGDETRAKKTRPAPEARSPQQQVDAPARRERGSGWLWLAAALAAILIFLALRGVDLSPPGESALGEGLGGLWAMVLLLGGPAMPLLIVGAFAVMLLFRARRRGEERAVRENRRARALERKAEEAAAAPGGYRLIPIVFLIVWLGAWSAAILLAFEVFLEELREGAAAPSVFLGFWLLFAALGWIVAARQLLRLMFGR